MKKISAYYFRARAFKETYLSRVIPFILISMSSTVLAQQETISDHAIEIPYITVVLIFIGITMSFLALIVALSGFQGLNITRIAKENVVEAARIIKGLKKYKESSQKISAEIKEAKQQIQENFDKSKKEHNQILRISKQIQLRMLYEMGKLNTGLAYRLIREMANGSTYPSTNDLFIEIYTNPPKNFKENELMDLIGKKIEEFKREHPKYNKVV